MTAAQPGAGLILVTGSARCAPGKRDVLIEGARRIASASVFDTGCLLYEFGWSLDYPDLMVSTEVWQSAAALDDHMSHPHTGIFMGILNDVLEQAPNLSVRSLG